MLLDRMLSWETTPKTIAYLKQAVAFNIDNVAVYRAEHLQGAWKDRISEDIPNVAPISPIMWFEWSKGLDIRNGISTHGALVVVLKDDPDLPDARWQYEIRHVMQSVRYGMVSPPWAVHMIVRADGSPKEMITVAPKETPRDDEDTDLVLAWGSVVLLALCFAHCRGVVQREARPSRQVARQAERSGKPVVTYKVLDIDPVRKVLQTEGHVAHNGLQKALHICRGHFAHYTEDKPLFGKLTGTFYVPMHTRGSLKAGAVVKDYRVLAPPKTSGKQMASK